MKKGIKHLPRYILFTITKITITQTRKITIMKYSSEYAVSQIVIVKCELVLTVFNRLFFLLQCEEMFPLSCQMLLNYIQGDFHCIVLVCKAG